MTRYKLNLCLILLVKYLMEQALVRVRPERGLMPEYWYAEMIQELLEELPPEAKERVIEEAKALLTLLADHPVLTPNS